jgi:hypothetical protein
MLVQSATPFGGRRLQAHRAMQAPVAWRARKGPKHRGTLLEHSALFGAVGVEGHESVVAGILLALTFIVAAVLVWGAAALLERRQRANL